LEEECNRLRVLVLVQQVDNLSLVSNNMGTQSSNQEGGVEAEIVYRNQVPMEFKGIGTHHSVKEQKDQDNVQM
jgi:hypothetical protein